jgi:lambda family phage portal protein
MKFRERIARSFGFVPKKEVERLGQRLAQRTFTAAINNRITADWSTADTTIDSEIYSSITAVRARARNLVQNNDYAKRYLGLIRTNIVGPTGFKHQMNIRELRVKDGGYEWKPDTMANLLIEEAWRKWTESPKCSVNGRLTFRGICDQMMRYAARDGEGLCRIIYDKRVPFGVTLQIIDPQALDEMYNDKLPGGNVVRMGVEIDSLKRPVAYYFKKSTPELEVYGLSYYTGERVRVLADEIIHLFDQEYENQTRGISWLVASMYRLRMLTGYEEAALINARVAAAKGGFFVRKDESQASFSGSEEDEYGNMTMSAQPGEFEQLPPGMEFQPWTPEFPSAQHADFMKTTLRGISSGLGVNYNLLGNNLEGVNYSSLRGGVLDERETWKLVQTWFVEQFLEPIFSVWLEAALLTESITYPSGKALPVEGLEKFDNPIFVGRRWPWVDPLKDVEAAILERSAGLSSTTKYLAEKGEDIEDVYNELAWENELAKKLGLELKTDNKATQTEQDPDAEDGDDTVSRAVDILNGRKNGNHNDVHRTVVTEEKRESQVINLNVNNSQPNVVVKSEPFTVNLPPMTTNIEPSVVNVTNTVPVPEVRMEGAAVTVNVPEQRQEPVVVNMPTPVVNVTNMVETPEVNVTVERPPLSATVTRDGQGKIKGIVG